MNREQIQMIIVLSITILSVLVAGNEIINPDSDMLDKTIGYITVSMAFIINHYFS